MMDAIQARDLYQAHFERLEKELATNGQVWLLPARKEAISHFARLGFPTTKHEEWKYTSVAPIVQIPFAPAPYAQKGFSAEALERIPFGTVAASRLVFVNGYYAPELFREGSVPAGLRIQSLAAALDGDRDRVEPHLARYASFRDRPFVALNTAFLRDGAFVYVPKGKVVSEPIHLLYVSTGPEASTVSYPRNLILVSDDSQVTIVESYVGWEKGIYFTNAVTELLAGENAVVDYTKLQQESGGAFHIATLQAHLGRHSSFVSHSIDLGSALARNDLNVVLDGEGSECTLNGLYLLADQQHVDNHTRIDHVKPHCTSRELYKGVLDGRARGVFNGKIIVHPSAPKTDAKQTNKNLLLSGEALVDTKPQLEIFNNDVRCTHGSTIGQVDQDAIFYLRSRGLELEAARSLLTYAFATEVTERIRIEAIRTELDHLLMTRFQGDSRLNKL